MTINTQELTFILENTPASQNIMLVGKHGIGKSRILEEYFAKKGEKVITLFLGQMSDPGDLIGLPHLDEETGKTDFMLPYWFPTDGKPVVLFLDELNRARPELLQTVMDLTLNRKLAGKSLPQGSRIISAVNGGNEYQLTDLDPALVSRFNIYDFAPSVKDWLDWAKSQNLDSRVISFIEENPEYLDGSVDFSNDNLERNPDRRSWERVSSIIKIKKENLFQELPLCEKHKFLLSGIVGDQAAAAFFHFIEENKLPSAKSILCEFIVDFEKLESIQKLSVPQLCRLNEALFIFIESEACENLIADNLERWFDFISQSFPKEVSAHFISLCTAERFPKTLVFITKKCPPLYEKILSAIDSL
ncbi:MAG: AAA family ATPase [Treponema sp.]|nr:AAA family ATPase [Treponema sp.]